MKTITGVLSNKTEAAEGQGHSQLRFSTKMDLGDGTLRTVEVILSTADYAVLDAFPRGAAFNFVEADSE